MISAHMKSVWQRPYGICSRVVLSVLKPKPRVMSVPKLIISAHLYLYHPRSQQAGLLGCPAIRDVRRETKQEIQPQLDVPHTLVHLRPVDLPLFSLMVVVSFAAHDDELFFAREAGGGVRRVGDDEHHGDAPEEAACAASCQHWQERLGGYRRGRGEAVEGL